MVACQAATNRYSGRQADREGLSRTGTFMGIPKKAHAPLFLPAL